MEIPILSKYRENQKAKLEAVKVETQYYRDRSAALSEMKKVAEGVAGAVVKMASPGHTLNDELYGTQNQPYASQIWQTNTDQARRMSRIAYWSSPEAQAMLGRFVDMVYGPRLELQSMPAWDLIPDASTDQEVRQKFSNMLEVRYRLWAKSKKSDYIKDKNHYKRSRENFFNLLLDGEYFNLLRYSSTRKRNPLTVQHIVPENVKRVDSKISQGNSEIDGIEYNGRGEAVAYHIFDPLKDKSIRVPKFGPRSGRQLVIHNKLGSGRRGTGILAGIITEITKIADFQALEIQAATINALFAVWVETEKGGDNKNLINKKGITGLEGLSDSDLTKERLTVSEYEAKLNSTQFSRGGIVAQGLGEGQKLHSFDTKRPTANFSDFYTTVMKNLYAAKGMSHAVARYDFDASYSAARGELLVFWNRVMTLRFDHSSEYEDIIFQSWMWGEIDNGKVDVSGWEDETVRDAWSNAWWTGPTRPDIDPLRSVKAHETEDKMSYKTAGQITSERGGGDFKENVERKKGENKIRAEANEPMVTLEKTSHSFSENKTESKSETVGD